MFRLFEKIQHLKQEDLFHSTLSHDEYTAYIHDYENLSPQEQKVVDLLQANAHLTEKDVAQRLHLSDQEATQILQSLQSTSWIAKDQSSTGYRLFHSAPFLHAHPASAEEKNIHSTIWKRVVANLRFQALAIILGYITSIIWAKSLGLHHFGFYSTVGTGAALLAILLPVGFNTTSTMFIPAYLKAEKWGLYRGLILYSYKLVTLFSLLLLVVAGGIIFALPLNSFVTWIFLLTLVWGISAALTTLISGQLEGQKRFKTSFFYGIFFQPVLVLIGIGIYHGLDKDFHTLSAIVITMLAQIVLLILMLGVFLYGNAPSVPKTKPEYDTKKWKQFSFSAMVMAGFLIIINRVDLVIIDIFISHRAAGVYMGVLLTTSFLALPFKAFKSSLNPSIAQFAHTKRFDLLQDIETYSARRCFLLTLLLAIIFTAFAPTLLGHFGDHQGQGFLPFLLFALTWIILGAFGSPGYIMLISGKQKKYLKILIGCILLDIGLLCLVVPFFGLVGAALVSSVCLCLNRALASWATHRDCKIHTSILGVSYWPELQKTQARIAEQASK